ncbi:MAG: alpha/beta fold hydrolase [Leptolyngbyaceae cyanobacterium]
MKSRLAPALFAPVFPRFDRPLMVMLPGLDGTGKLFAPQLRSLAHHFDIRCLVIPEDNRQDWPELSQAVAEAIEATCGSRPIYLCGESFGGCLALQVTQLLQRRLTHLVLVNPASALRRYAWLRWTTQYTSAVPSWLFKMSGTVALPLLANFDRIAQPKRDLFIKTVRPISQSCVAWRIDMLHRFEIQPSQLAAIKVPTTLLASGSDRLFPSDQEAQLLRQSLWQANIYNLPNSGHVCLLEDTVDLSACLKILGVLPSLQTVATPLRSSR